jgi:uncharacterized protein DUF4186
VAVAQGIQNTLKPLKITCTSVDCEHGLHCFRQTQRLASGTQAGHCRACGVALIDWSRVYQQDPADASYTFAALKYELIRHYFWHIEIDVKAVNHARRKGTLGLYAATEQRLRKAIGPAAPSFDGRQTPCKGNVIYYAQHATASCCRKCVEEWHGIPQGRALTDAEIGYLTTLATLYIAERIPALTHDGEKVPRLNSRSHDSALMSPKESAYASQD